ncbi:MAG: PstS family phosphate ABC transporter substrate-binding protein [Pseudomonadota bacterium]
MFLKKSLLGLATAGALLASATSLAVDSELEPYERASGISGNLTSIGSDTLNNLMTLWAEDFQGVYPNINIQIQGAGSSTAPPAMAEGTANFGPMSRMPKDSEQAAFEEAHGYSMTAVPVAIDTLAVYVNKDNPIEGLTLPQVDAIYSETRRCGHSEDLTRWGQLGLSGDWENRDITLYGRNSVSGTYGYFRKNALCDGDYKASVNEQPGSASVVQGVSESLNGIGYSGIGYKTSGVRAVPLAEEEGGEFIEVSPENAANGTYPLARFLYIMVNKRPGQDLAPREAEFLKMVLSRDGQETVERDGYVPLPAAVVEKQWEELGLE